MRPRIYTYKVTFEEILHWYWGVHKEKKCNDGYIGSPSTHKWMWEFYTPKIQILEVFPFTEEGWKSALQVERRLILPDLNNPLCLNEGCNLSCSIEASKTGGVRAAKMLNQEKDELGRSVQAVKGGRKVHEIKDDTGRSVFGVRAAERLHSEKDELGRSIQGMRAVERMHSEKDERGKCLNSVKGGKEGAKKLHSQVWESTMDGFRSNAGAVANHNKANGWPPGARIRVY